MADNPYAKYGGTVAEDPYAKYGGATSAPSPAPQSSTIGDVLGGIADTTVRTIPAAAKMAYHGVQALIHPLDSAPFQQDVKGLWNAQVDQAAKAKDAWNRGEHVEAVGHGMAAALPLFGPAAAKAGETIGGELAYGDPQHPERATGMVRAPQVARGIGQGIGVAASASPKNVVEPLATKAAGLVSDIPVPARFTPEGMYQSALRPGLSRKNLPKIDSKVQTGLREGIPVSKSGLENTNATIDLLNNEIASRIASQSAAQGPVVDPTDVATSLAPIRKSFGTQVNPKADLAAIDKSQAEFLDKHTPPATPGQPPPPPQKLTLSEAQAEKQGTYRQLSKKYGELGSADVEAQKALAKGLKEEIAKRVPEISALNARDGSLIELQTELERMVAREGNKNLLGLVPATMSHNPFGFLATLAMDNPAIKSRVAIALDRARSTVSAPGVGKMAAAVTPTALAGESQQQGPAKYARGGVIRKPTVAIIGEDGPEAVIPIGPPRFKSAASQLKHEANSEKYKIEEEATKQSAPPRFKRN